MADSEAALRRKFDAEWDGHLKKYAREHNLNLTQLTESQAQQIGDEARRWLQEFGTLPKPDDT